MPFEGQFFLGAASLGLLTTAETPAGFSLTRVLKALQKSSEGSLSHPAIDEFLGYLTWIFGCISMGSLSVVYLWYIGNQDFL